MDRFELITTLSEHGITVPDRCIGCQRLGNLASILSQTQEDQDFLVTEVMAKSMRAQLTLQVRGHYPNASDEEVAATVDKSIDKFLIGDGHSNPLRSAGALLEQANATIASSVEDAASTLSACPPEGFS
jgi:hypothetical protein